MERDWNSDQKIGKCSVSRRWAHLLRANFSYNCSPSTFCLLLLLNVVIAIRIFLSNGRFNADTGIIALGLSANLYKAFIFQLSHPVIAGFILIADKKSIRAPKNFYYFRFQLKCGILISHLAVSRILQFPSVFIRTTQIYCLRRDNKFTKRLHSSLFTCENEKYIQ